MSEPLFVEIVRGLSVESVHLVDAVVVNNMGEVLTAYGDPTLAVYPRSAIKPLQALPFVLSKAFESLQHHDQVIALACASHHAEAQHLEVLLDWQQKSLLQESDLICGPQPPEDEQALHDLVRHRQLPTRLHNNCSGKHTAFLMACRAHQWPSQGYQHWDHPLQVEIRRLLTQFSGVQHDQLPWGIDGCGIPTYSLELRALARMMSAFLRPDHYGANLSWGLQRIREACARQPWMIGGRTSLCSQVGLLSQGSILAKIGAEGVYSAVLFDEGTAISLKARDGGSRACEAALAALLRKHSTLKPEILSEIETFACPPILNWAGETVGHTKVRL
ncbi:MAG: asparaginase [Bdellovibrio sp.]